MEILWPKHVAWGGKGGWFFIRNNYVIEGHLQIAWCCPFLSIVKNHSAWKSRRLNVYADVLLFLWLPISYLRVIAKEFAKICLTYLQRVASRVSHIPSKIDLAFMERYVLKNQCLFMNIPKV